MAVNKLEQEPQIVVPTEGPTTLGTSVETYRKYFLGILVAIEERLPIAGALIAIVGYIVIAAFGHMDNIWSFLGYFSFLILGLLFYKIKTAKLTSGIYLLLGIIIILLIYIAIDKGFLQFLFDLISQ